jgi:hypothetical protein
MRNARHEKPVKTRLEDVPKLVRDAVRLSQSVFQSGDWAGSEGMVIAVK